MMIDRSLLKLNLVYPDKSNIKYDLVEFSDGQVQFTLKNPDDLHYYHVEIVSRMSWKDLQVIIAATQALGEAGVEVIHLTIPYFLGGRSDRKFQEGGSNYIKTVIAPIINSLEFGSVEVLDPHSDVIEACIDRITVIDNVELVRWALEDLYPYDPQTQSVAGFGLETSSNMLDNFVIISPDAGAMKKIYKVAEFLNSYNGIPEIVIASKRRDIKTGKILSTEVPLNTVMVSPKDYIIIDDICDGGRTFIEIAKVIKNTFPSANIYLIVTHGIFSAGLYELSKWFKRIYSTNSIKDIKDVPCYSDYTISDENFLKQLNVFE